MVEFKKQKHFPYLQEFKQNFPITENTIFVFDKYIYTNNTLPDDIVIHEIAHLKRQQEVGAKEWIQNYITIPEFRLNEEKIAYLHQLRAVKKSTDDREELFNIMHESAMNISSGLYGKMISYQEAWAYFRKNLK